MTLDVEHLRLLDPGVTAGLVQHAVDEDYKHLGYVEREDTKTAVFAFLTVMKPGDLALYQSSGTVRVGVVLGEPEHREDNRRLRRKVRWFDEDPQHDRAAPPRAAAAGHLRHRRGHHPRDPGPARRCCPPKRKPSPATAPSRPPSSNLPVKGSAR